MGAKKQEPRCKLVAYYRTSTDDPKLGIEAQKATAARVSETTGCKAEKVFTEHESGGNNDRVELDKAIRCARRIGATLVVAKLDRLPRDSAFLMKLSGGDVPILFGDMPEVDGRTSTGRLQTQMMANFSEPSGAGSASGPVKPSRRSRRRGSSSERPPI